MSRPIVNIGDVKLETWSRGTLYAVSFVLFCVLAWSAAGALLLGASWRRLEHGVGWAALLAA